MPSPEEQRAHPGTKFRDLIVPAGTKRQQCGRKGIRFSRRGQGDGGEHSALDGLTGSRVENVAQRRFADLK